MSLSVFSHLISGLSYSRRKKAAKSNAFSEALNSKKVFSPWVLEAESGELKRLDACSTWDKADSRFELLEIKLGRLEVEVEMDMDMMAANCQLFYRLAGKTSSSRLSWIYLLSELWWASSDFALFDRWCCSLYCTVRWIFLPNHRTFSLNLTAFLSKVGVHQTDTFLQLWSNHWPIFEHPIPYLLISLSVSLNSQMAAQDLPLELLSSIFSQMPAAESALASRNCKHWRATLTDTQCFWGIVETTRTLSMERVIQMLEVFSKHSKSTLNQVIINSKIPESPWEKIFDVIQPSFTELSILYITQHSDLNARTRKFARRALLS